MDDGRWTMDDVERIRLDRDGYPILKGRLPDAQVDAVLARLEELWTLEGDRAGQENYVEPGVRRLANLADKGQVFRPLYGDAQVLEVVEVVMGRDIRAAMVNARDALPHTGARMPFHMDSDKGRARDATGYSAATAIWMLDDFTAASGATAFVPGSHLIGKSPKEVLPDANAPHPEEIILEGRPGDVLVFNGHCWHAGRPNTTGAHRRAVLVHYLRADVPRPENRRQHLATAHAAALSARERELLGLDDAPEN